MIQAEEVSYKRRLSNWGREGWTCNLVLPQGWAKHLCWCLLWSHTHFPSCPWPLKRKAIVFCYKRSNHLQPVTISSVLQKDGPGGRAPGLPLSSSYCSIVSLLYIILVVNIIHCLLHISIPLGVWETAQIDGWASFSVLVFLKSILFGFNFFLILLLEGKRLKASLLQDLGLP